MKNNKGFSLVELLVTVAIIGIFGIAIVGFFYTGTNSYSRVSKESELQYNAQLTVNQVENLIVDASKGLGYSYSSDSATDVVVTQESQISGNVTQKKLTVYNSDTQIYITWEDDSLYLQQDSVDESGSVTSAGEKELLADNVKGFTCDIDSSGRKVDLGFNFVKTSLTYDVDRNISLRNGIIINGDLDEIYPEDTDDSSLESLAIWYNGQDVTGDTVSYFAKISGDTKGSLDFTAKASGKNHPSADSTWTISQVSSSATSISGSGHSASLTLGKDESQYSIVVTATSSRYEGVSAYTTVLIKEVTGVTLNRTTQSDKFHTGDTFIVEASVDGRNLDEEDKTVSWTVSGAERTDTYSSDSLVQEFKITAEADETVEVRATSNADDSYYADMDPITVSDVDYTLSIDWTSEASTEVLRNGRTNSITATISPDDKGKHTIYWEYELDNSSGKDVTSDNSKNITFTNTEGSTTQLQALRTFDWTFSGSLYIKAYIKVGSEKVYSNSLSVAVNPVKVRLWQGSKSYDITLNTDKTFSIKKGKSKVFYWEVISGFDGVFGVVNENNYINTSMDDSKKQITVYANDTKTKTYFSIQLDNLTLAKIYINIT